ncbi:MFS transporter [Microbacterium horticulturae]|uniref:MFS transporter n=1 Tax=Microbacterium horticulturae TaxID=3028316 RepID=A0ABY8BXF6_9MICO|nr:MFS transporter [Microbacterium sp. KACC 23027]WEG07807.1 MFS transporter [Microbacterium sp. KACC 23027]
MTIPAPAPKFAVLRSWKTAPYLVGAGLAMMGDNIEHVITYLVLWNTFHSPILVGFQLVSHWLPYLLLSVYAGALAQRFDCRRIIQGAQILFMFVSLCWGILFLTGTLQLWQACVLLVLHGLAGCLWGPAEQMMLYDFAGREQLPSAVRINATFRSLGVLFGPVVGSVLLLTLGTTWGIFANIVFYLPLTLFLARTKFTGHSREGVYQTGRVSLWQSFRVLGTVRKDHVIMGMLILAALASVSIGAVLQTAMPVFGNELTPAGADGELVYGALLFALGIGGVVGGFFLEASGWIPPTVRTAVISSITFGAFAMLFAFTGSLVVALIALVLTGFSQITATSTGQAIVQLEAPAAERGRVLGAYSMFGPGMQTFSGVTIGALGTLVGIPITVVIGGAVLVAGALLTALYIRGSARRAEV